MMIQAFIGKLILDFLRSSGERQPMSKRSEKRERKKMRKQMALERKSQESPKKITKKRITSIEEAPPVGEEIIIFYTFENGFPEICDQSLTD